MPKTLTLSKTKMQSIQLNQVYDKDGNLTGISSSLNYAIVDANDNEVMYKNSTKYTSGTNYSDDLMSAEAEKKLNEYWNSMVKLMTEREKL